MYYYLDIKKEFIFLKNTHNTNTIIRENITNTPKHANTSYSAQHKIYIILMEKLLCLLY